MKYPTLLETATGPSKTLDRAVAKALDVPLREYSSSVDTCLKLIHELLPNTHWHVGRAENGVSFYATLSDGRHREESAQVTVPLALLTVAMKFLKWKRDAPPATSPRLGEVPADDPADL